MQVATITLPGPAGQDGADLTPTRVRHPLRFRVLDVCKVDRLTPHLVRVTLSGDALEGFVSAGFDDHVKLFFPDPVTGLVTTPTLGADGPVWAEGTRPVMRDYTPHHFDPVAHTLEIDFALHHPGGPATQWAEQAQVGQKLGVGGPKGSFIVPTGYDWHLLIGDDTALPAIARRLAELPAGAHAEVLIEVDSPVDHIPLPSAAGVEVEWVYRSTAGAHEQPLVEALRRMRMPAGFFHTWIGCESAQAKALRSYLITECLADPKRIRASGYWRRGSAGTHDALDNG
ncbi:siderophore-interacting protein [Rhodoferax saidenbachensis]|uniref:Siderophore-interacting protein n=1 Tax=Rhodoferax saidenbachensis TaxID=1484693 RepID=A0A1P8K7I5_9BURK|nr:siderophore-interacting protein [Rhodoferax saidenbachensis]APW41975.1 siderophore-interacting protein [Rhodoferax saidenbachensis]